MSEKVRHVSSWVTAAVYVTEERSPLYGVICSRSIAWRSEQASKRPIYSYGCVFYGIEGWHQHVQLYNKSNLANVRCVRWVVALLQTTM
jgi:hypothetical protein